MPHKKKPGIAVIISIGKKPKPDMKKYLGDAMPNAMNKAWKVLKIQDWRTDNLSQGKFSEYPRQSPFKNRSSDYPPQRPQRTDNLSQGNNLPLLPPQLQNPTPTPLDAPLQNPKPPSRAFDPEQYGPAYPMAKVNPNVPKQFQQGIHEMQNQSPNQPLPPPNTDPSWTPEEIARINAQNDEARRALRGGE